MTTTTEHSTTGSTAPAGTTTDPTAPASGILGRIASFAARHRRAVIAVWLIAVIAAAPAAITVGRSLSGAGWDAQSSTSQAVRDELRRDFAAVGAEAAYVVYTQPTPIAENPGGVQALVAALDGAPGAAQVVDPLSMPADAGMVSPDGTTALIPVALAGREDADLPVSAGRLARHVRSLELDDGASAEVTGEWPMWSDFNRTNERALHRAEIVSGIPTVILLLVAFGGLAAAGIPLALAIAGIAIGFASLHLIGLQLPVSVWAMNFSMMIGLAVGIDYSLFILSRYREERARGRSAHDAIVIATSTAGKAVFLSAITVVFSLAAVFVVPVMVFRSMALGMILSVVAVAIAALTLLPAVVVAMGDRAVRSRRSARPTEDDCVDIEAAGRWERLTRRAIRRPALTLALGIALLAAIAAPALGMRLGMPGARVVDEGYSSRDGYETMVAQFGEGAAAPAFVTVEATEADTVVETAQTLDAVVDARVVSEPSDTGRVVVRVTGSTPVDDTATGAMVAELRSLLHERAPSAAVGGPAAQNHDLTEVLTGRAPVAIAIILVVAFVLLLVVFRSLVIAVFSILMNLLTVAAAFGFATLVFQHGIGASWLGIEHQGFVDAWAPLFFFALLFGLSMDYQLFLLAAIRERYERHGSTLDAVTEGISHTGRPITNAALIMIVVFIAFGITGPIPPTELGLTLAVAVALDATVVRVLLVPATMVLLDRHSWYLPRWLGRILPKVSFTH